MGVDGKERKQYGPNNPRLPVFYKRFKALTDSKGGITSVSELTGLSRPTIQFWYNGQRTPDAENLCVLSKKLGVSADWLLGLTDEDNSTSDEKIRMVSEYTGLSNLSVKFLHYMNYDGNHYDNRSIDNTNQQTIRFLNRALECGVDKMRHDEDGDTFPIATIFTSMERYVCSGNMEASIGDGTGGIITFKSRAEEDTPLVAKVEELYKEALITNIRDYLNMFSEREDK